MMGRRRFAQKLYYQLSLDRPSCPSGSPAPPHRLGRRFLLRPAPMPPLLLATADLRLRYHLGAPVSQGSGLAPGLSLVPRL